MIRDKQNKSFVSVCLDMNENNIEHMFIFEEDTEVIISRIKNFEKIIAWGFANKEKWDIIYGGCAAINPMFPTYFDLNISYSSGGQLGGHCMLFSIKAARKFLKFTNGRPFDVILSNINLDTYTTFLPAWYQNKNPSSLRDFNLDYVGDHIF